MNTAAKLDRKPISTKKFSLEKPSFKFCSHIKAKEFENLDKLAEKRDNSPPSFPLHYLSCFTEAWRKKFFLT
jgi:hypothetical protein